MQLSVMQKTITVENKKTGKRNTVIVRQMAHDPVATVGKSGAQFGWAGTVIVEVK